MTPKPWLRISNLEKSFATKQGPLHTFSLRLLAKFKNIYLPQSISVLSNIDLDVLPGECIGVHGPNGSGKSTFLKCIAGVMHPTKGCVEHFGNTTVLLTHGLGAYEDLPVWRNILLVQQLYGLTKEEAHKNINAIAEIANLKTRLASPTTQLSEGMRAKISLVALFFIPFDLLVIDESLNHVDAEFRELFFNRSREWLKNGKSILLTSHDPVLLKHLATRVLQIADGVLIPSNLQN